MTSDTQKGKISCYLTNMGSYKGKNTNLRITFTDWDVYRTEEGKRYYPLLGVAFSKTVDFYGLLFSDIWYEAKLEILDDQGRPLAVDMTYRAEDLDYGQIFGVKKETIRLEFPFHRTVEHITSNGMGFITFMPRM